MNSLIQQRVFDYLQDTFKFTSAYQVLASFNTRSFDHIQWPQQLTSGIHLAAFFNLQNIMEHYCDKGDDLQVADHKGQSLLSWAIDQEYPEVVRVLVRNISSREPKTRSHSSALLL